MPTGMCSWVVTAWSPATGTALEMVTSSTCGERVGSLVLKEVESLRKATDNPGRPYAVVLGERLVQFSPGLKSVLADGNLLEASEPPQGSPGGVSGPVDFLERALLSPLGFPLEPIPGGYRIVPGARFAEPVMGLAGGVFIAGVAQLAFQFPFLKQLRLLPRPRWGWRHEGVRRIIRLMLPAIFGSSVAQINILINTLIASFLISGSISWLYYSDRFVELPLALFGVAIGTVILPKLSRDHSNKSADEFSNTLGWALRLTLLMAIPAMVGLIALAGPILITLIQAMGQSHLMLPYMMLALASGFMGVLMSPLHLCLLLSNEYFETSLVPVYRHMRVPLAVLLAATICYFTILSYTMG